MRHFLKNSLVCLLLLCIALPCFAQTGTQNLNPSCVTAPKLNTTGTPSASTWLNGGGGVVMAWAPLPAATAAVAGLVELNTDFGGLYTAPNVVGLRGIPIKVGTPSNGQTLVYVTANADLEYQTPGTGSGTVTSVGLTVPGFLSVAGSPITGSGTFAVSLATQAANQVFAGPASGSAATPTFRSLVTADLPTAGTAGTYGYPVSLTTNAAGQVTGITSGTAPPTYTVTAPLTLAGTTLGLSLGTGLTTSGGALTRTTTGTAGTYGDATHYPVITTNAYGDVTGVTTQAVTGGGSGTVTSVSASSTYPGMTVTVTNPTTTPAIAHTATTGLTANQFVGTPNGSLGAVALRSIASADLPAATTSALGAVQPDGTSVTISGSGVISAPGSGITQVSSDPTTPAVGVWWENTTTHTLKTKEPSGNYWGIQLVSQALGKPASGTAIDTGLSISSGIVLAFPLNEGTGTTATDRGTGATNGALAASTMWASDATYTKCLTFSGSQTVTFPHSASDDLTTFTISTAFKSSGTGTQVFYNYGGGSGGYPISLCLQVSNGIVSAVILNSSGSTLMQVSSGSAGLYDDGNWHSVVCTYSTTAGSTLYVDSAAVTTAAGTTTTVTSSSSSGLLGKRSDGAFFFTGSVGYVTLWNRILASGEITTIKSDPFAPYR